MIKKNIISLLILTCAVFTVTPAKVADSDTNWISELSSQDFLDLQTYQMPDISEYEPYPPVDPERDFPEIWDWREMGGVSTIKSQGPCGSCWAFTALGVLESQILIDTGVEYDFSEQQLLECTPNCYGCYGGATELAFTYMQWQPIRLEADYPYIARPEDCRDTEFPGHVRVTGYEAYYVSSEEELKAVLTDYGPVGTTMGSNDNLKAYTGGCYADDSNTNINHGVVIVGWDDTVCEGGSWIAKNSWGVGFGEDGYFYIRRGDVSLGEFITLAYYEIIPPVEFTVSDVTFTQDDSFYPEAGHQADVSFTLKNIGREGAQNISATLTTTSTDITILSDTVTIEDLQVEGSTNVTDAFQVEIAETVNPGTLIPFTVSVQSDTGEHHLDVTMIAGPVYPFYTNGFEGDSNEGWTTVSTKSDRWERGSHTETDFPRFDPERPFSGDYMWGLRLNKNGNYPSNHNTQLHSPVFDCSGHSPVILNFQRWLSVEKSVSDQAYIEINGTKIWENSADQDMIDTFWNEVSIDVSQYLTADAQLQVTFGLISDGSLEFGGWNIDQFRIITGKDASFNSTFQERMDLSLGMPDREMELDDQFTLYSEYRNYGPERDIIEFVALEVAGLFWYWPSWSDTVDFVQRPVAAQSSEVNTILTFAWPEVEGHAEGIRFWLGAVGESDGALLDYDLIEWGW